MALDQVPYAVCVIHCGASALCCFIHTVKKLCWHVGPFDQLVCEIMELLDRYTGHLKLKRTRDQGNSLTLITKCPDLCILVRNALLFNGEEEREEDKLDLAVAKLKQKMRRWSQSYHGQVNLSLVAICLPFCCVKIVY